MRRILLALPMAACLLLVGLSDSAGQPPGKTKAKSTAPDKMAAVVFEMYKDSGGEHYRFRLKAGDTILAISSKGYDTKDDCRKVIEQIQKEAGRAKITEEK